MGGTIYFDVAQRLKWLFPIGVFIPRTTSPNTQRLDRHPKCTRGWGSWYPWHFACPCQQKCLFSKVWSATNYWESALPILWETSSVILMWAALGQPSCPGRWIAVRHVWRTPLVFRLTWVPLGPSMRENCSVNFWQPTNTTLLSNWRKTRCSITTAST